MKTSLALLLALTVWIASIPNTVAPESSSCGNRYSTRLVEVLLEHGRRGRVEAQGWQSSFRPKFQQQLLPIASNRILPRLFSTTYFAIHAIVPQNILNWIAHRLPYEDDAFVPAGFFVTPPELPKECCPGVTADVPLNQLVLVSAALIRGRVVAVEPLLDPANHLWNHNTYYLKPDNLGLLNAFANRVHLSWKGADGTLKCEPPISDRWLPKVGERVVVVGTFYIDLANGWTSVLPIAWAYEQRLVPATFGRVPAIWDYRGKIETGS